MTAKRWLYVFNFADPHDEKTNYLFDYDDALSSRDFWIEADDPQAAQRWGDNVATAFVAWMFEAAGASEEPWHQGWPGGKYGSWIEDQPEMLIPHPAQQVICIGQMPDFARLDEG